METIVFIILQIFHATAQCFHELRQPPLYYCLCLKIILSLAKIYSVASVYVFYKRVYVFL